MQMANCALSEKTQKNFYSPLHSESRENRLLSMLRASFERCNSAPHALASHGGAGGPEQSHLAARLDECRPCRDAPPKICVVPDAGNADAFAIEVGGQPLVTGASLDLCQLIAHRYRNPEVGGATDGVGVLAEGMRRWARR